MSLPKFEAVPFTMIYDENNTRLQELMHGDDVRTCITSNRYPTVFNDPDYPDLVVVWDSGEGPHNPYCFTDEHLESEGWMNLGVYPKPVWDLVVEVAKSRGLEDTYAVFWLKGEDRA
jgi:hypothetical protein